MPTVRKWSGHDGFGAGIFFLGGLLEGVFEGVGSTSFCRFLLFWGSGFTEAVEGLASSKNEILANEGG
jgi:hypothetical protein